MKKTTIGLLILLILALSLYFSGCATIATGTTQLVTISSNVDGADILLDGIKVGQTPFTGEIKKNGKMLSFEMEGYKTHQVALSTTMEGAFWGNIILGGTIGSITDFGTGAAYKYAPASFQVELKKKDIALNSFMKEYELKKFAMVNMSNIAIDLSNGNGEYLKSVLHLANMKQNENSKNIIRDLLVDSNGDQIAFGKTIVELLNI